MSGRHHQDGFRYSVVELKPSTRPGTFGKQTYVPVPRWLKLPGAFIPIPLSEVLGWSATMAANNGRTVVTMTINGVTERWTQPFTPLQQPWSPFGADGNLDTDRLREEGWIQLGALGDDVR